MPYFTIVMPTYNQGEFIETAVRSVLGQQGGDFQLVVYDALSTDATPAILEKYGDRLVWIREKDRGMVDAINRGLGAAGGEVLAWLNSDDAYLPGALVQVRRAFNADPDLDFVYGDALEMNRAGDIFTPNQFTEDCSRERYLHSHNFICQPTMFFRRRILEKVGPLREDLLWTMDYEWFARFFLRGCKGRRLPYFLAANRDHAVTKTNTGGLTRYREMIAIHRIRPGRPLCTRRSFWIYTAEAGIKGVNGLRDRLPAGSRLARALSLISRAGGNAFLRFVDPRCREEIVQRYHRDIAPRGVNIRDQWGGFAPGAEPAPPPEPATG